MDLFLARVGKLARTAKLHLGKPLFGLSIFCTICTEIIIQLLFIIVHQGDDLENLSTHQPFCPYNHVTFTDAVYQCHLFQGKSPCCCPLKIKVTCVFLTITCFIFIMCVLTNKNVRCFFKQNYV